MSSIQAYQATLSPACLAKLAEGLVRANAKNALFEPVLLACYLEDKMKTIRLLVTLKFVSKAKNAQTLSAYPFDSRKEDPLKTFMFVRDLTEDLTVEQTEIFNQEW